MNLKEIKMDSLEIKPFELIGKDAMLITAGDETKFNTMTASWGGIGVFWGKNTVTIYVRPQRYTREFIDANETFTLSFFEKEYKSALALCGKVSGRDVDKVKETGLTPVFSNGSTYFEEAKLVLVCKKMYHCNLEDGVFDQVENDKKFYPTKDYHKIYIAEVLNVFAKE